jgi:hypothetical protein
LLDQKIKGYKQTFGLALFEDFVKAEDTRGYLPSDRQVRSIYDTCRGDIQRMEANKKQKMQELQALGGTMEDTTTPSVVEHGHNGYGDGYGDGYGSNGNGNVPSTQNSYTAPSVSSDDLLL